MRNKTLERIEEVMDFVKQIPRGKVASYGEVARAIYPAGSPRFVGRALAECEDNIPWWRVVGAHGTLPIHKRDPNHAIIQQAKLSAEGVSFSNGIVDKAHFYFDL